MILPDQLTTQASALLHGRGHREPKSETFEPRWRNHLETQGWQKTSINLGLGTGCGPAFVQSLLIGTWIMMRSATDLSKADLHVFSKLFADGLKRGQEAKAFSWRQIGGHDD